MKANLTHINCWKENIATFISDFEKNLSLKGVEDITKINEKKFQKAEEENFTILDNKLIIKDKTIIDQSGNPLEQPIELYSAHDKAYIYFIESDPIRFGVMYHPKYLITKLLYQYTGSKSADVAKNFFCLCQGLISERLKMISDSYTQNE